MQHAMLVLGGDTEERKHDDEHEDVVDGERLLDDVAGKKLKTDVLRQVLLLCERIPR